LKHSDFSTPNTWSRCLDKHKFHCWLQDRVDQNFQAGELVDIGVNSPRSTFCLFFILSGGHFPDAMRNARHQTEHQARKCHRDAVACRDKLLALGCSVPVGAHSQFLPNAHENALVLGSWCVVLFGVCGGQQLVIFVARLIQRLRKMRKEVEPGAGCGALFQLVRTHSFS
jgi:hypothetical protein